MNTYVIRITTINNLYADYIVNGNDLRQAELNAERAFFRDYPGADLNIKLSLVNPNENNIKEIINTLKEAI